MPQRLKDYAGWYLRKYVHVRLRAREGGLDQRVCDLKITQKFPCEDYPAIPQEFLLKKVL